jgi:hypothetical protein
MKIPSRRHHKSGGRSRLKNGILLMESRALAYSSLAAMAQLRIQFKNIYAGRAKNYLLPAR